MTYRKPTNRQIAAHLDRSATRLLQAGWVRGTSRADDGRVDLWSAVSPTVTRTSQAALSAVTHQLQQDYGESSIVRWNDSQRDRRKVLRLLHRTARSLRH